MTKKVAENPEYWWNPDRVKAAELLAEGKLSDEKIAESLDIHRRTLDRWKTVVVFRDRVAELCHELADKLAAEGVRLKVNRLRNLQNRVDRMHRLIEARAEDLKDDIAGGETGLLVRDYKHGGTVYKFDAALLRELREHEKQAAIELGQFTEKRELEGQVSGDLKIVVEYKEQRDASHDD